MQSGLECGRSIIRADDGKAKHPCFTEKYCGHL